MADKKLLLSNGNGKYQETGSVTVDDTTGKVTIASLNTTNLTLASLTGILSASNGSLSSFSAVVTSGSIISSNGTSWGIVPSGTLYGDLSGTLSSPIVKSVANVVSGTLPVTRGGTGVSSPALNGVLIGNGTSPTIVTPTPSTNDVLYYNSVSWGVGTHPFSKTSSLAYELYTSSATGSLNTSAKYVRFIIQGAGGGGGGGGGKATAAAAASGGGGGGGGGLTDVTISISDLPTTANSLFFTVGQGGAGALSRTAAANAAGLNGSAGGDSYVTYTDIAGTYTYYFKATGGGAGLGATTGGGAGGVGGAGGKGLTADGAAGGTGGVQATANTNMSGSTAGALGAGGGGGGGGNTAASARGPTGPGGSSGICVGIQSSGASGNAAGATSSTNGSAPTAQLRTYGLTTGNVSPAGTTLTLNAGGGSGGTASTTVNTAGGVGGNGSRGSGGGGGGASVGTIGTPAPQNGGNGGDGYILVIYYL